MLPFVGGVTPYLVLTFSSSSAVRRRFDQITSVSNAATLTAGVKAAQPMVQERYGDRLRTGQLHHRRGIDQIMPPPSKPTHHDRSRSARCVILSRRFTSTPTGWRFRSGEFQFRAAPERQTCSPPWRLSPTASYSRTAIGDAQGIATWLETSIGRRHLRVGNIEGFGGIRGHGTQLRHGATTITVADEHGAGAG